MAGTYHSRLLPRLLPNAPLRDVKEACNVALAFAILVKTMTTEALPVQAEIMRNRNASNLPRACPLALTEAGDHSVHVHAGQGQTFNRHGTPCFVLGRRQPVLVFLGFSGR